MNYEDVCKMIGHLYITSTQNIAQLENKVRELTLVNQKLSNSLKEKEEISGPSAEGTPN